ncbi:Membrane Metallo-Endopeptidase-Like 1 [Manis pentadactyla]|nr:Membrane Metallo-Endopeptidase-Like 1 [Manis pentadactyla]
MEMACWQGQKRQAFLERVLLLVTGTLVTLGLLYVDSRAAGILQSMDPSKKPCDDFYQHARGGWLRHHVIPEASAHYSISDILRGKLEVILKRVLENSTSYDRPAVQKARTLYHSCMD